MTTPKVLFGFHAVGVRLKTAPASIVEIYFEVTRRDARMRMPVAGMVVIVFGLYLLNRGRLA